MLSFHTAATFLAAFHSGIMRLLLAEAAGFFPYNVYLLNTSSKQAVLPVAAERQQCFEALMKV